MLTISLPCGTWKLGDSTVTRFGAVGAGLILSGEDIAELDRIGR
jgi:hypothetical protein